jgi:hypothetical protein
MGNPKSHRAAVCPMGMETVLTTEEFDELRMQ